MPVTPSRLLGALALAIAVLALSTPASAQPHEDARSLFMQGADRIDEPGRERWGEALEFFRRSYALVPLPAVLYNVGLCLFHTGRYLEAIATFEEYLAGSEGATAEATRRRSAAELVRDARRSLAPFVLEVQPADAEVRVDGAVVPGAGARREIALDPGEHSVEVRAPRHAAITRRVSVLAATPESLAITLEREAAPAPRLRIEADHASAQIFVDGALVGVGRRELQTTVGPHEVEVRVDGRAPYREEVHAAEGDVTLVHAHLGVVEDELVESPILWTIVALVAIGAGVGIGLGVHFGQPQVDPGSSGVVIPGLTRF